MAIDSAEKRRSVSQILTGVFPPGVTPNASKDAEWRQQSGWGYSGIVAAEVVIGLDSHTIYTMSTSADLYVNSGSSDVFTNSNSSTILN